MKPPLRIPLLLTLILCLALPAAAQADTFDDIDAKLGHFYDALVKDGIDVTVSRFDEQATFDDYGNGEITTYYPMTDYLMALTREDSEYSFTYALSVLQADVPEDVSTDNLYAIFLAACAEEEVSYEDCAALVSWLREYAVQTDVYLVTASRAFGPFTATIQSSLSDSEEFLVLTRYTGIR